MTPPPPDDLDRLLSGFFHAQMPDPWPACPLPPAPVADARGLYANAAPADAASRSRVTLAASVAALLGLGLAVSSAPRPQPATAKPGKPAANSGLLERSTADGSHLVKPTGR